MKATKRLILLLVLAAAMFACTNLDEVHDRLDNLEAKVKQLEGLIDAANLDIKANKALIDVEGKKLKVLSYKPLADGSGYELTMSDNSKIVLKNGQDGKEQIVGVKKDADGKLYWTINGEFMLAGGQKVLAQGADGQPGATPLMTVDKDGYWQVSTDGGTSWKYVQDANGNNVKAKGEDGQPGQPGQPGEPGKDAATDLKITESEDGKSITITFNGVTYTLPISGSEKAPRPKLPIEYLAEYNVNPAATGFVTTHEDHISGLFNYEEMMDKLGNGLTVNGVKYHIPTEEEWASIIMRWNGERGYFWRDYYTENEIYWEEGEVMVGGKMIPCGAAYYEGPFTGDWKEANEKMEGVIYAIRYKNNQGKEGNTELTSAWRYEYIENPASKDYIDNTVTWPTRHRMLKITVRYLGLGFEGSVKDIANPEYWNANNADDIVRILPASHYQGEDAPAEFTRMFIRYLSSTESGINKVSSVLVKFGNVSSTSSTNNGSFVSNWGESIYVRQNVRLFSNE
jgi:hypothetical protein